MTQPLDALVAPPTEADEPRRSPPRLAVDPATLLDGLNPSSAPRSCTTGAHC